MPWPKCTRVKAALAEMGYTGISVYPGYIAAENRNGVRFGITFFHLRGYERLIAPFRYNADAEEHPEQGPPERPRRREPEPEPSWPPRGISEPAIFKLVFPE